MAQPQSKAPESFVVLAAINASISMVNLAYNVAIFNSIQKILQEYVFPDASTGAISFIASAPFLGGLIGALFTELIGRKLGRRATMILSASVSLIGVILTLFPNLSLLMVGRVLTVIDGGVATVIVDIYITEITREPLRGQLGSIPNIAVTAGMVLSFLMGLFTPMFIDRGITDIGYRILLLVPGILGAIKILNLLLLFKFETPFYLVYSKKEEEAKETLQLLYEDDHTERLQELILERDYIFHKEERVTVMDLFTKKYRKAMFIAGLVSVCPFLIGVVIPTTFSNMLFSEGLNPEDRNLPILLTNLIGLLAFFSSFTPLIILRHFGRRTLAITGNFLLTLINLTVTIICFASTAGNFAVKILIILYGSIYFITFGNLGFLYPAESLPEIGVGIVMVATMITGFVMTQVFLPSVNNFGYQGTFLIYTVFSVLSCIILYFYMVESKAQTKLEVLKKYAGSAEQDEKKTLLAKEA